MAKVETMFHSYEAATLKMEKTANTYEELRDTFAYLKAKKIPITIERVTDSNIMLGASVDGHTYLRIHLTDARI